MTSYLFAFAVGIGIIFSFAGWGWLVGKILKIRYEAGFGFHAAVGLSLTTSVGAFLNYFHLISPAVVRIYVLAGLLLALAAGAMRVRGILDGVIAAWAYCKSHKLIALVGLIVVAVSLVKYASIVSPGQFHLQDDYHAYFVFPEEMLQTGTLGSDPFSERRIVSSLGGKYFLDTLPLSFTGQVGNLRLSDEGVAFLMVLLLMAECMVRKRIPAQWTLLALLAASSFPAPLSNITSVYGGIALLLLVFDLLDRTVLDTGLNQAALMAIVLASLMTLKTTFAPMAGIFFLSFFAYQWYRSPSKAKSLTAAAVCGGVILVLLAPWMLYSYQASGTFFYPLFGKGYHGSRYGTYLLPTADMGWHNVLAFFDGLANAVGAVLAIEACLVLIAVRRNRENRLIDLVIIINLFIDVVFIGIGTGGVQMFRYSFAILFAIALFLLIQELSIFAQPAGSAPLLGSADSFAAILLLGMLLGAGWHGFTYELKDFRLAALKFGLTGKRIDSPSEVAAYRDLQDTVQPGQAILVRLDRNYLLNFRRNPIYINDLPGGASLPPGIPIFKGPEALASYLLQHNIRYLAYSYGDEATFSRALFGDRLEPNVNIWLRKGAQIAFDFQDNAVILGRTRKKLYDNGHMFVLDLATPENSGAPVIASAAH